MINEILSCHRAVRYRRYAYGSPGWDGQTEIGEDLRMRDGSIWFHPYSGGQPRKIGSEPCA